MVVSLTPRGAEAAEASAAGLDRVDAGLAKLVARRRSGDHPTGAR